ncbi:MAG: F0F1 ATP synthase subunit B [Bacteroidota bacterium]
MELITPGIGLVFWMVLSFSILLFLLKKFAWKPIILMLNERENTITEALDQAKIAREEMKALQANNEQLIILAKEERDAIIVEARHIREKMIEEAKLKANEESQRIIDSAKASINYEKMQAITELKNQVAQLSIDIAEKLLNDELDNKEKQNKMIEGMLKDIRFN